jgi:hypothetical protein
MTFAALFGFALDIGDNALFRLAEHWRHNAARIAFLMDMLDLIIDSHCDANRRLESSIETPVMLSTVSIMTSTPESLARCSMARLPRSLWK